MFTTQHPKNITFLPIEAVFLPLLYCPNIFLKKSEKDLKTTPISKWANSKKRKQKKNRLVISKILQ